MILAGGKGWLYDEIYDSVNKLHLQESIKFLGYIPDDDVPKLLCGADLFVFPSLYEGFGLPVLEAMACGVPVISSNVASLPEVAKSAAILVDPQDVNDISQGIEKLIQDKKLCNSLIVAGLERAKEFTWEKTADRYIDICKELTR